MAENRIILIYKSSTGFTERYAEMIADETGCDLIDHKAATAEMLSEYDTVIFGSRAHAGMIDGYKKITKLFEESKARKFILFVTGATPNDAGDVIEAFWKQNLTDEELSEIPHFYMQGGLCYEKMSLGDKLMMKAAAHMMKKKKDKSPYDKELEQAVSISCSYDISSKKYIEPLLSFLNEA